VNAFTPAQTAGGAPTAMSATLYEIRTSLNVLESVVRHIGTMSGQRKAIFYVSTGVALPPQNTQAFAEVIPAMRRVFDAAQTGNVMIYGLDPGGLGVSPATRAESSTFKSGAAGGRTSRHEFLLMLAENTGGRSIVDRNNPEKAVKTLLAEHNHYYHVAYESPLAESEPPRRIEVKVNRRGTAVRFRSMNTPWRP
jgi:VWFA-related protein